MGWVLCVVAAKGDCGCEKLENKGLFSCGRLLAVML
jgi:hypothetical protein